MGFYVTGSECECREKTHPPSKNRVWDFFATSHTCAGQNVTFAQYPRPENEPTPTATASGARYCGYRFYSPGLGRWISKDPIVEVGGINLYIFSANQPINIVDPYGLWGTAIHRDAPRQWAEGLAYKPAAATAIGDRDEAVDGGTTSPYPIVGDQSYHFNRNSSGQDSRLQHFDEHFKKAKERCTWKSGFWGWFSSHDDPNGATDHFGKALHPRQDWVAHGDFGIRASLGVWVWHNYYSPQTTLGNNQARAEAVDNPQLDSDGLDGRPAGTAMHYLSDNKDYALFHAGTQRLNLTRSLTESALREFLGHIRANAKPCGKCREYFLQDNDPGRWR